MEHDPTLRPIGVGVSFCNSVPAVTHVFVAPVSGWMNALGVLSSSSSKNASNLFLVASCFGATANSLVWIRARSRNSLTFLSLVCREDLFRFNAIKLILFLRSLLFSTDQPLQFFSKTEIFLVFPHM